MRTHRQQHCAKKEKRIFCQPRRHGDIKIQLNTKRAPLIPPIKNRSPFFPARPASADARSSMEFARILFRLPKERFLFRECRFLRVSPNNTKRMPGKSQKVFSRHASAIPPIQNLCKVLTTGLFRDAIGMKWKISQPEFL